jgi:predicted RNase H-like HicB family nuclease
MKFHVFLYYESETGWYIATCPALSGCVSQGKTEDEAMANLREAILAWLEVEDEKAVVEARNQGLKGKELRLAI